MQIIIIDLIVMRYDGKLLIGECLPVITLLIFGLHNTFKLDTVEKVSSIQFKYTMGLSLPSFDFVNWPSSGYFVSDCS